MVVYFMLQLAWAEEPPEGWPDIISGVCQGVSREIRCESVTEGSTWPPQCVWASPSQPQLEQRQPTHESALCYSHDSHPLLPDVAPGSGPFKLRRT